MIMSRLFRFAAAAAITTLCFASELTAQAAPPDPWRMVPAFPTTCFRDDGFVEKLDTTSTTIQAEIERQKQVNEAARARFDSMDMMEKAQRMQAFMMKNPQAAARMLEAQQAAGAAGATNVQEAQAAAERLEAELQRLQTSFRAAADQAVAPIQARQRQLIETKTVAVGEAAVNMFTSAADHAQYVQLIAEENAAYEKACAPYFGAGGSFHKWLSSYRTELVEKVLAVGGDDIILMQMQALDLPGGGYRSTSPLEQVDNYLRHQVRRVFDVRPWKSQPRVELRRD